MNATTVATNPRETRHQSKTMGEIMLSEAVRLQTGSTVPDDAATGRVGHGASVDGKEEGGLMIWAILALLGVPLWLCAIAITVLVFRNRALRKRYGDIPVRILRSGKKRWSRGHAIWVSDVFAWRASPASWKEGLEQVTDVSRHEHVDAQTAKKLHRLGDSPVVASLTLVGGDVIEVAVRSEHRSALMGPFAKQPGAERQQARPAVTR
jgi:hypothetical protein